MFTKEALQALRAGLLNSFINQRGGDVLTVLHQVHHALFLDFAVYVDVDVDADVDVDVDGMLMLMGC
jgi:hypothetical protein